MVDCNAFVPLCDSCGYDLRALGPTTVCPECGKPVAGSMASGRRGSAWQRGRSVRTYVATTVSMVVHPVRTMRVVVADPSENASLALVSAGVTGATGFAAVAAGGVLSVVEGGSDVLEAGLMVMALGFALAVFVLIACITWVEFLAIGARVAHRIARGRYVPGLAISIASHAAVVIPIGAVLFWMVTICLVMALDGGLERVLTNIAVMLVVLTLGASVGLTVLGAWLNRFANRPGAQHALAR